MTGPLLRSPFGVAAFLLPLVALFQNKLIAALFIALTVAALIWQRPRSWRVWPPLLAGLAIFLTWCLTSALWSIDPGHSLMRFARLAPTVLAGVVLGVAACSMDNERRSIIPIGLAAGLFIASAIALMGQFAIWTMDGNVAGSMVGEAAQRLRYRPFSSVAALLLFPLATMAFTRRHGWILLAILPVAAGAILATGSNAAITATAVGAVVFGLAAWLGANFLRVLAVVLPVAFIGLPGVTTALDIPSHAKAYDILLYQSAAHRLVVWQFVNGRIAEKPYLGWGLHTARLIPGGGANANRDPDYADILSATVYAPHTKVQVLPQHPHNATLHARLELGLPGMILYAALYCLACLALLKRYPAGPGLVAGAAVITAAFVTGQLSFSIWQSWWLGAQFSAAALLLAMIAPGAGPGSRAEESL